MKNYVFFNRALELVTLLVGLSAVVGGLALIFMDGLGMPKAWLSSSPFTDYFWPGVILCLVVGGTYISAFWLLMRKNHWASEVSGIAGFGLLIWIFTEMFIIRQNDFLQICYFALGIGTILLAYAYKIYQREGKL